MVKQLIKLVHNELTKWNWMVQFPENLILPEDVDVGAFCYLGAHCGIEVGRNVQIGSHCSIYSLSTIDKKSGRVVIGDDVCIGTHSTIMPGVEIGRGAVVGAYSFVNKSIPAGELWVGVPAKFKRGVNNG